MHPERIKRRKFIQAAGAVAAASSTPWLLSGCSDGSDRDQTPDQGVIVIGAGVAGLVVANALTAAGVKNVVLEARPRLGGRVFAPEVAGVPVDAGGMWISGAQGNPAACVINDDGGSWSPAEPFDLSVKVYDAVLGRAITLAEVSPAAIAPEEFNAQYDQIIPSLPAGANLGDAVSAYLAGSSFNGDALRYAEFGLTTQIETDLAESARFHSITRNPTRALPGGEAFPLGTYNGLINALGRGLNVQLDTVVSEIRHTASGVTVSTSQGEYRGSHVVVTVPLGVLKAGALSFSPPLPASKQAAIDRLGMGSLEKVILRYDSAFWPAPGSGNFLYVSPNRGEFPLIVDYTAFAAGSPTVVGFYSGDYRRAIVAEPDSAIAQRLAEVMGQISGIPAPAPIAAHVTRWKADPFAGGSYSYLAVGATPADYAELALPVGNRLLFAGEATSVDYNGYVHGAMLTGIREAERLLGREGRGVRLLSGLVVELGCNEKA